MIPATVTILDDERLIREGEAAVDGYNEICGARVIASCRWH